MFDELVIQKLSHYTLKNQRRLHKEYKEGTNSSLYGSARKLDFMLMYLKENPNQTYHSCLFGLCHAKVSEWVSYLTPVLEEPLRRLGYGDPKTDFLLVDVTEREAPQVPGL